VETIGEGSQQINKIEVL